MSRGPRRTGIILVITGEGKGKTTSALGIAVRAAGHGMKVTVIQFVKGDMYAGEIDGLRKLEPEVELYRTGRGFFGIEGDSHSAEEHRRRAQDAISLATKKVSSGACDVVILDEINVAVKLGLIDVSQVIDLIDRKPPLTHLILTGRDAHPEVVSKAHTVTEMKEVKHACTQGIGPQKGIDF